MSYITLEHGAGGKLSHELLKSIFVREYGGKSLAKAGDKAVLSIGGSRIAFTTDAFVMSPRVVPGCSIGKLCITGTINDLLTCGARPLFISASFIIEEGFPIEELSSISTDLAGAAKASGIEIVTGDTKVVQKDRADGVYVVTSGIGEVLKDVDVSGSNARAGDDVIVTGELGCHGVAVMLARGEFKIAAKANSDCNALTSLVLPLLRRWKRSIHALRDPTRGGISTTLCEIAIESNVGIEIDESMLPISNSTRAACELLGIDPLFMANEGVMAIVADHVFSERIVRMLRRKRNGENSRIIGNVVANHKGKVKMKTKIGGERYLELLRGMSLPRIC